MITQAVEQSPRKLARVAGIWYAALTAFSVFGVMYAASKFYVPHDAAATAARIASGQWLFRLGIASDLAGQACFLFAGLAFYKLFKAVDKDQARAMLALVVAGVPVAFLDMLGKFAPLVLLGDSSFAKAFEPAQLQALAMLFIELQKYGILIVGVFWGLWLLPLGILVFKSGYFPKVLGILLAINCAAYLVDTFMAVVFPEARAMVLPILNAFEIIGEVSFLLWLLAIGARSPARTASA